MRTKCRRLFQHAAVTASVQCTWGNSQLRKLAGRPGTLPARSPTQEDASARVSVHYMTINVLPLAESLGSVPNLAALVG